MTEIPTEVVMRWASYVAVGLVFVAIAIAAVSLATMATP